MDNEQRKRKERLKAETTDYLGSAPMVSLKGQPFLDADGEKPYLKHESLEEEQGKRKPKETTRS